MEHRPHPVRLWSTVSVSSPSIRRRAPARRWRDEARRGLAAARPEPRGRRARTPLASAPTGCVAPETAAISRSASLRRAARNRRRSQPKPQDRPGRLDPATDADVTRGCARRIRCSTSGVLPVSRAARQDQPTCSRSRACRRPAGRVRRVPRQAFSLGRARRQNRGPSRAMSDRALGALAPCDLPRICKAFKKVRPVLFPRAADGEPVEARPRPHRDR